VSELLQDVRHAVRLMLKNPGFSAVAVLTLALGIGANTTIFSIANALFLQPLPVKDAGRLVALYTTDKRNPGFAPTSHLNWRDYRQKNDVFESVLGYDFAVMSVVTSGEARMLVGQLVSGNYFDVLGVSAARGRTFEPREDETPTPVAVLSHGFWLERLGGDPQVIGRSLSINNQAFTVIGVAPPRFTGTDTGVRPELWLPMSMNRVIRPDEATNWYEQRRGLFISTVGRLKPGVSVSQASSSLVALATNLEKDFPNDNKDRSVRLVPLAEAAINPQARGDFVAATSLLMTVVGFVLLVACANVSNLLLARALARRREIAIRLAIGASRARLVRQLLTESMMLALPGALIGLLIASWSQAALLSLLPSLPFPVTVDLKLGLDVRVLLFTTLVALSAGLLFGLVPALQASRPELLADLKNLAGAGSVPAGRFGVRNLLVASQVALSLVALVGAFLFVRSLGAAERIDPGFESSNLASMSFNVGLQGYSRARGEAFFRDVRERVGALPGVAAVALAQGGPLQGTLARSVLIEEGDPNDRKLIQVNPVGPGYFETLGIKLLRGRPFDERDGVGAPKVVVVNETMAKKMWPNSDALGKRFRFFSDRELSEVVGVAKDAAYNGIGAEPQNYIYESLLQRYSPGVSLIVRTAQPPELIVESIRREVATLDRTLPIVGVSTISQTLRNALWAPRIGASLLAIFGGLALLLASIGIYGVTSYLVRQRQREIGIRMALGARRVDILALMVRQGMFVVMVGLAAGLAIAFALTRLVANMLFGISPADPISFALTALVLGAAALLANLVPARRAAAVDPTVTLRG
jgi:predicted permease